MERMLRDAASGPGASPQHHAGVDKHLGICSLQQTAAVCPCPALLGRTGTAPLSQAAPSFPHYLP